MKQDAHQGWTTIDLLKKYFGPLVAGLLVARVVALYAITAMIVPVQTDVTFPEGALVARAMDVAQGRAPYQDWRRWPHAFAPYPPLAYYPAGWLARAMGAAHDPDTVYIIGRTISFAALAGIFLMVYLLGRRLGLTPAWSLVAGSLLGQFPMLVEYCVSFRPDAPKTFFALLALLVASGERRVASELTTHNSQLTTRNPQLTTHNSQLATRHLPLATLATALGCLIVSAWFKPTAWGIGLVLVWWIWRRLGWKKWLGVMLGFVAAGAGPLLLLNHHGHGLLLLNIVDSLVNGWTLDGFRQNVSVAYLPALVVAVAGCVVACKWQVASGEWRDHKWQVASGEGRENKGGEIEGRGANGEWRDHKCNSPLATCHSPLILAAAVASMLAGLAQFFKVGSDLNYFLDGYPLAGLALAWGAARMWNGEVRWPAWLRAAIIGLLICVPLVLCMMDLRGIVHPFKVTAEMWKETPIQYLARRIPGPILATNPFVQLTHPDEPAPMDYFQYGVLCGRGKIDSGELLGRVREKQFRAVIISEPILALGRKGSGRESELYCREFMPALEAGYTIERKVAIFYVWVPK